MLLDTQPYKVPAVTEPIEPWRQLLLDAADLIDRQGWWDGTPTPRGEQRTLHCIETAISAIGSKQIDMARSEASVNFSNYVSTPSITWNDAPGRTKEEVLAAMRGAARS